MMITVLLETETIWKRSGGHRQKLGHNRRANPQVKYASISICTGNLDVCFKMLASSARNAEKKYNYNYFIKLICNRECLSFQRKVTSHGTDITSYGLKVSTRNVRTYFTALYILLSSIENIAPSDT